MNLERVETILRLLQRQSHVGEVAIEGTDGAGEWKLRARRMPGLPPLIDGALPLEETPAAPVRLPVLAGMVGIFRGSGHAPRQGTHVPSGTVVGSIDAMGILNPVTVEEEGYLLENRVEDGQPVEFGQVLFMLSREPLD